MDPRDLATVLALAGLLGWGLVELRLRARTPAARTLRGGPGDRGTTRLTAAAVGASLAGPWAWRALAGAASPGPLLLGVGALGLGAGLALRAWAMAALGPAFTRALRAPEAVLQAPVEAGPYRWLRHPGYLAALLALPAHALLATGRPAAGAAVAGVLAAAYARRIPAEEALLAERFGPAWEGYRRRTALLLPGIL